MAKNHCLYLIPTPISRQSQNNVLPEYTIQKIHSISTFIVEKPQTAISFLKWIGHPVPDYKLTLRVLNKKTPDHEIFSFLELLKQGDTGVLSEAGAPCVADPGSKIVDLAHQNNYKVVPLTGPSSILLALMASGLNGQSFAFNGYLPINEKKRLTELKRLEQHSRQFSQTQIIMETPHRNMDLFNLLCTELPRSVKLCIASNLTSDDEWIKTRRIDEWKKNPDPELISKPVLFLFNAG